MTASTLVGTWKKVNDTWCVRVEGVADQAAAAALVGQSLPVRRRTGDSRQVKLLALVSFDAGSAIYEPEKDGNFRGYRRRSSAPSRVAAAAPAPAPMRPRTVQVSAAEMTALLDQGAVTVDGVTLVFDTNTGSLTLTLFQ
jgi:hypothetical protein